MKITPELSPVTITLVPDADPDVDDFFKVDKPLLTIHPGDQVTFKFNGCKNPIIMIPVEGIFTETIATDKKNTGVINMYVREDAIITEKRFPYMVYSPDTDIFAEGNSPPRMIIDKKP